MLPPECETAIQQLDAFRRGELADTEMQTLRQHLDECYRCLAFNRHEVALLERLVAAARGTNAPEELRAAIYQMIAKESRDN